MVNYCKKDLAIKFANGEGCFVKDMYLGMLPNGNIVWYGRGYRKSLSNGEQETLFIIPRQGNIEYVPAIPKNIKQVRTNDTFILDGVWCQYQHKTPIRYTRNQKGSDIIVTKSEVLDMKQVEMLPYTNSPYRCYAVMEKGVCVNFLWAAGEVGNFIHSFFALDTVKVFNPQMHTLRQLKNDDYIRCPAAENGRFCFYNNNLLRVDINLLSKVRKNNQPVNWL